MINVNMTKKILYTVVINKHFLHAVNFLMWTENT